MASWSTNYKTLFSPLNGTKANQRHTKGKSFDFRLELPVPLLTKLLEQKENDKKLENEHFKKYPYEQLTCDELEKFIEIIETAKLFGKRIG